MTKRIFYSIISVAAAVLLASVLIIFGVFYSGFSDDRLFQLQSQAKTVSAGIFLFGTDYLESIEAKDYRMTYISSEGE
ncbi:MAG: PAS domain-containing sensor histidine kinase, partial [Oscillospiraceae bacterium]|nr:PAS domain-containing sensor histidine kinase [Oscillospiraceae bacterium]